MSDEPETLADRINRAAAAYDAMTPQQKADMRRAQRESFVRAMTTPCEHGVLDFEQCGECRI